MTHIKLEDNVDNCSHCRLSHWDRQCYWNCLVMRRRLTKEEEPENPVPAWCPLRVDNPTSSSVENLALRKTNAELRALIQEASWGNDSEESRCPWCVADLQYEKHRNCRAAKIMGWETE